MNESVQQPEAELRSWFISIGTFRYLQPHSHVSITCTIMVIVFWCAIICWGTFMFNCMQKGFFIFFLFIFMMICLPNHFFHCTSILQGFVMNKCTITNLHCYILLTCTVRKHKCYSADHSRVCNWDYTVFGELRGTCNGERVESCCCWSLLFNCMRDTECTPLFVDLVTLISVTSGQATLFSQIVDRGAAQISSCAVSSNTLIKTWVLVEWALHKHYTCCNGF